MAEHGVPASFGPLDALLLRAGVAAGRAWPRPVAALLRRRAPPRGGRASCCPPRTGRSPATSRGAGPKGIGLNVNLLGEAILGDDEAARRLDAGARPHRPTRRRLRVGQGVGGLRPLVDAGVRPVGGAGGRRASAPSVRAAAAPVPPVFVNLDMEEYRDLELTLRAFQQALDAPGPASGLDAGIVLQAYLPDSHDAARALAEWAAARHGAGGGQDQGAAGQGRQPRDGAGRGRAARLVGRRRIPTKLDVDASYKRLLARALDPCWGDALRVGLASHNLFDVAWGVAAGRRRRAPVDRLEIEMLEGMAPGQAEAVRAVAARRAAVRAGGRARRVRLRRRLPGAPARREQRTRQLPAPPARPERPAGRRGGRSSPASLERSARRGPPAPPGPHGGGGAHGGRGTWTARGRSPTSADTDWAAPAQPGVAAGRSRCGPRRGHTSCRAGSTAATTGVRLTVAVAGSVRPLARALYAYRLADLPLVERAVAAARRGGPEPVAGAIAPRPLAAAPAPAWSSAGAS